MERVPISSVIRADIEGQRRVPARDALDAAGAVRVGAGDAARGRRGRAAARGGGGGGEGEAAGGGLLAGLGPLGVGAVQALAVVVGVEELDARVVFGEVPVAGRRRLAVAGAGRVAFVGVAPGVAWGVGLGAGAGVVVGRAAGEDGHADLLSTTTAAAAAAAAAAIV